MGQGDTGTGSKEGGTGGEGTAAREVERVPDLGKTSSFYRFGILQIYSFFQP